jgi:hypothetical protein
MKFSMKSDWHDLMRGRLPAVRERQGWGFVVRLGWVSASMLEYVFRGGLMETIRQFLAKQFIDVIQWTESEDGVPAYMEIQNGGQLIVRESEIALFVNQGRIADGLGRAHTP